MVSICRLLCIILWNISKLTLSELSILLARNAKVVVDIEDWPGAQRQHRRCSWGVWNQLILNTARSHRAIYIRSPFRFVPIGADASGMYGDYARVMIDPSTRMCDTYPWKRCVKSIWTILVHVYIKSRLLDQRIIFSFRYESRNVLQEPKTVVVKSKRCFHSRLAQDVKCFS